MGTDFNKAFEFVIRWEGYKSEDSSDPGGRTIFGISSKSHPQEVREMWNLSKDKALDQAKEIYRVEYWEASGCNLLTEPFDMIVFDTAVNMGVSMAKSFITDSYDWKDYLLLRASWYFAKRKQYPQFIFGWFNRVFDLWETARRHG